jgi:hypothetical protein
MSKDSRFNHDIKIAYKVSFFKFKLLRMLDPENGKDLIWIFKNFLCLERQKLFKKLYESFLDLDGGTAIYLRYERSKKEEERALYPIVSRLMGYFESVKPEMLLPLNCFPPIKFEKSKNYLSMKPAPVVDEDKFRELTVTYLLKLDIKGLYIPPPDVLHKVGNQKYSDGGIPKKDYEVAKHYWGNFVLQKFMAQPLQPREVWLPCKLVKNNNLFWTCIGKQILDKDPVYPSQSIDDTYERLRKEMKDFYRFDLSGFGLQFPRVFLRILVEEISSLYSSSWMDIATKELHFILDNVKVEDGIEVLSPPRGIGLGYYEYLKTICIRVLLDRFSPHSVYGDQGLVPSATGWEAIEALTSNGFLFEEYDKIEASSAMDTSPWHVKWGGVKMTPTHMVKPRIYSTNIISAFFQGTHWERKMALSSFSEEYPEKYVEMFPTIKRAYLLYYSFEFYPAELDNHFLEVGINPTAGLQQTVNKDYLVAEMRAPPSEALFEPHFVTPFKRLSTKSFSPKEAKAFQRLRVQVRRNTPVIDTHVHYYWKPRIEYNQVYKPKHRVLPMWAEYLYVVNHMQSTGALTYDLSKEEMRKAILTCSHSSDPLKAYASGGYKVLDRPCARSVPSEEWIDTVTVFSKIEQRDLMYCRRVDLFQSTTMVEDDNYRDVIHGFSVKGFDESYYNIQGEDARVDPLESQDEILRIRDILRGGGITNAQELVRNLVPDNILEDMSSNAASTSRSSSEVRHG